MNAAGIIAQCVMCFRTAAAQQGARSHALNKGILILLIPPIAIAGVLTARMLLRSRPISTAAESPTQPEPETPSCLPPDREPAPLVPGASYF